MGRRVRPEAPQRLLPLRLRSDRFAPSTLVRGDDDVNEPLEEVALVLLACAPCLLEGLVRLEERSGPSQGKAPLV